MLCSKCGYDNQNESKFCSKCGSNLSKKETEVIDSVALHETGIPVCMICGVYINSNEKICSGCGAIQSNVREIVLPVDSPFFPTYTDSGKKHLTKKTVTLIKYGATAIILIIAITLLMQNKFMSNLMSKEGSMFTPNYAKNIVATDEIKLFYDDNKEKTIVVINGKLADLSLSEPIQDVDIYKSAAGDFVVALSLEKTLYYINDKSAVKIASDVKQYKVSYFGDMVAYINTDDTMFLFTYKTGKKAKIANDISYAHMSFSPDGKYFTYTPVEHGIVGNLYLYLDGESDRIGKNMLCVGINDTGSMYTVDCEANTLYLYTPDGDKSKISTDLNSERMLLNCDNTELIFISNDICYITVNGGEKIRLGNYINIIGNFYNDTGVYDYLDISTANYDFVLDTVKHGVWTFKEKSFLIFSENSVDSDDIIYVNEKYEAQKIADEVRNVRIKQDYKSIYYVKGSRLFLYNTNKNTVREIANDVVDYMISDSEKYIYYINYESELWAKKGAGDYKIIADGVYSFDLSPSNTLFFLTNYDDEYRGALFLCDKKHIKVEIAKEVSGIEIDNNNVYYYVRFDELSDQYGETYDLYASNGDGKFTCLGREIKSIY